MSSTRGTGLPRNPDWRDQAECRHANPDDMFPDPSNTRGIAHALSFCNRCPVRKQCLDKALAEEGGRGRESRFGIRGGLTEGQRYYVYSQTRPTAMDRKPRPSQSTPRRSSKRAAPPCGTNAGYKRHVRDGEPVDEACRQAHNAQRRATRAKAKERAIRAVAA